MQQGQRCAVCLTAKPTLSNPLGPADAAYDPAKFKALRELFKSHHCPPRASGHQRCRGTGGILSFFYAWHQLWVFQL